MESEVSEKTLYVKEIFVMKKMIIVCEAHLKTYGDYLAQLISSQNDKGDIAIGIKDGSAVAQVWTEKEYVANAAQISSEQYILFIGNSKLIRDKRNFMQVKFSKYGMKYGWLGKQAVLFVDNVVSIDEYESFFSFATGYQPEIEKLIETKPHENFSDFIEKDIDDETLVEDKEAVEIPKKKGFNPSKFIKNAVVDSAINGAKAIEKVVRDIDKTVKNKDIEKQEYSCLVRLFYLQGLSPFLGFSEVSL